MAQVTKNIFKGQTAALYADNVAGGISAADLRAQMDDIADSAGFTSSGNTVAPTSGDDTFDIGDVWVDETANTIYMCVDNTASNAIWVNFTRMTDAQVKTAYENNLDTNAYGDAEEAKLAAIEDGATADQTGAEIEAALDAQLGTTTWKTQASLPTDAEVKTAYENNADTNAFDDAAVTKLAGIEALADVTDATNVDAAGAVMNSDTSTAAMSFVIDEDTMASDSATQVPTQQSVKAYVDASVVGAVTYRGSYDASTNTPDLDTSPSGVLTGDMYTVTVAGTFFTTPLEIGDVIIAEIDSAAAETDWTIVQRDLDAASIKVSYESNADTNAFDDAAVAKLAGIEALATADQTGAEIKAAYEAEANAFTDAQFTKLAGIETAATADQTGAEIEAALDAELGSTAWRTPTSVITVSTSRALALTDTDNLLEVNTSGGAVDVTIPLNATSAFPIGTVINFTLIDATAAATITSVSGVTLNGVDNDTITMGALYDGVSIYKAGTDSWRVTIALTGAEIKALYEAEADTNAFDDAAVAKLAGIETAATADQTGAEIKAAYEAEANAFTDAQFTKLAGIETAATADQTGAEIETALDTQIGSAVWRTPASVITVSTSRALALTDANDLLEVDTSGGAVDVTIPLNATVAFPIGTVINITLVDATAAGTVTSVTGVTLNGVDNDTVTLGSVYDGISIYKAGTNSWRSTVGVTGAEIKALYEAEANAFTDAQFTKLAGIETAATADQTGAEIKTAYEAEANAFTDAQFTKLAGIETAATADQTGAEIKTAYEAEANAFTDAQFTKLAGIETAATADQTGAEIKTAYEAEANAFTDAQFTKLAGIEDGAERSTPAIVAVTTSRTLALTDERDILEIDTTGGAVALTIPANASVAFPVGTVIKVTLIDVTGAATIVADTGVTLNGVSTGTGTITATAYSGVTIYKRATDLWVAQGDIGAVA